MAISKKMPEISAIENLCSPKSGPKYDMAFDFLLVFSGDLRSRWKRCKIYKPRNQRNNNLQQEEKITATKMSQSTDRSAFAAQHGLTLFGGNYFTRPVQNECALFITRFSR